MRTVTTRAFFFLRQFSANFIYLIHATHHGGFPRPANLTIIEARGQTNTRRNISSVLSIRYASESDGVISDNIAATTHLKTLNQRRLLAADVRTRPSVQVDVKVVPRSAGILAQESFLDSHQNETIQNRQKAGFGGDHFRNTNIATCGGTWQCSN